MTLEDLIKTGRKECRFNPIKVCALKTQSREKYCKDHHSLNFSVFNRWKKSLGFVGVFSSLISKSLNHSCRKVELIKENIKTQLISSEWMVRFLREFLG